MSENCTSDREHDRPTHRKWKCSGCGHVIWLPRGTLGSQADHGNRPFCECSSQGERMIRMQGVRELVDL